MKTRIAITALIASTLTLIALTGCAHQPKTADEALSIYFQDLVDGKAEAAQEIVPLAGKTQLDDAIYSKASNRISEFVIGKPREDSSEPGTAVTKATFTVNGERDTAEFTSHKTSDGFEFEPAEWDKLNLKHPFAKDVKVNGVSVKAQDMSVFPGKYKVTASSKNRFVVVEGHDFDTSKSSGPALTATVVKAERDKIVKQLDSDIHVCMDAPIAERALACPNWVQHDMTADDSKATNVQWTMVKYPTYEKSMTVRDDGYVSDPTIGGRMQLTFDWSNPWSGDHSEKFDSDVEYQDGLIDGLQDTMQVSFAVTESGAEIVYPKTVKARFPHSVDSGTWAQTVDSELF
ncbi:hypothetical protein [Curtobacterium sp. CFBP9011]|uniref:hypothetical protein n=1 Tax=Curtobacterium sp. CFBP9011 TaxID=3096530 RepID=UPI002A69E4B5|nr:hypothetical protein [Curtobacterium sp. CFBP9011]MDY1006338.1 hypothetical protein [Curtobacterium sp. CFBP9011]